MLTAGTKVRTLYQWSQTGVIVKRTKKQQAEHVAYWGSEEKASQWYLVRFDDGTKGGIHREMLTLSN